MSPRSDIPKLSEHAYSGVPLNLTPMLTLNKPRSVYQPSVYRTFVLYIDIFGVHASSFYRTFGLDREVPDETRMGGLPKLYYKKKKLLRDHWTTWIGVWTFHYIYIIKIEDK